MKEISKLRFFILTAICVFAAPVFAELDHTMTEIAIPDQPNAIKLGTPPLPDAKASGATVIVAPGGGFFSLSMENEGSSCTTGRVSLL